MFFMKYQWRQKSIIPGFGWTLTGSLFFVGLVILLPIIAVLHKAFSKGWKEFWRLALDERAVATYRLTLECAFVATILNAVIGVWFAWILTRFDFPGRRWMDAAMDLPFALPTAVAGLSLTAIFAENGWLGRYLVPLGIEVAYRPMGIVVAMLFVGIPFVVRTVQPVLEELEGEVEEAASTLGASPLQVFFRVILPMLSPSILAGSSLSLVRSLGEFGAVIFIAGNLPFKTEVTALLIYIRLGEYDYVGAAAISAIVLGWSFAMLLVFNLVQSWSYRRFRLETR
jgi:sulfate transport system permease protein